MVDNTFQLYNFEGCFLCYSKANDWYILYLRENYKVSLENGVFCSLEELRKISIIVTRTLASGIAFQAVFQNYMWSLIVKDLDLFIRLQV